MSGDYYDLCGCMILTDVVCAKDFRINRVVLRLLLK